MENLYEFFQKSCQKYPDHYYIFDQRYWTYQEVHRNIHKMIYFLSGKGVKKNDKIILYLENSIEYISAYFSALYLGAIIVPITVPATFEQIDYIVNDLNPKLLLTSQRLASSIEKLNFQQKVEIEVIDNEKLKEVEMIGEVVMATGKLAMVIYTSGTTNKPKGVMLTHQNLFVNTESILSYLKLTSLDSILATLPFTYSYGNSVLLTHTQVGGLLYLFKATYPQEVFRMIKTNDITGFSTVGSFLNILLKQNNLTEKSFSSLRYITLAGEQTSQTNLIKLMNLNKDLNIYVMYGQTEASARLTFLEPAMLSTKLGSVGKPVKNVNIRIVDDKEHELPDGEIGEIIASGENVMLGYLNKSEATNDAIKDGWLYTGDLGYKDAEGYLYIKGRKDDIIKYLGYRISPLEIESCLNEHQDILESAVVECLIDEVAQIAAFLVLKSDQPNIDDVIKYVKTKLPAYKVPKIFYYVSELAKTSNGKIKRKELKRRFKEVPDYVN